MSENLLLEELEAAPVAESVDHIDVLVSDVMQNVGLALEVMKGSALLFQNAWRSIAMNVAKGQTGEMQAVRPRLLAAFNKRMNLLRHAQELAAWLRKRDPSGVPDPDLLLPEIVGMEQLKVSVFDRWQTGEDLEDLAARDYPLTTAELDRIGPQHRPPASWYAEESKPF